MFSLFRSILSSEEKININNVEPGRYPVNCNPRPKIHRKTLVLCGKKYAYSGVTQHVNKNYVIIANNGVYRHIIAYGPFVLVVDANTRENFIETYEKAAEVKRLDDNIPFTTHTYPEKYTMNTRTYYDGNFIYLGRAALYAPNLGSVERFEVKRIVFENGVFENNTLKYNFRWREEAWNGKMRIY